ncbi:hypothetical protein [Chitinophaga silvisoli]|uniref:Uncharacterized protein n=1 Tax=Chitinophaga silvisoli TaxID=2291814 RepID=A0A3E1NKD6_9BACT|nr:hypothetical protein [Chitinophaga silvisoli]RFM28392.1 hypothetical protein DXN04_34230 [Chitinophaga silvisoli]
MITQELVNRILVEIDALESDFQQHKGSILTEGDLKCQLFSRLQSIIPPPSATMNPEITGTSLHSEVSFFDGNNKLTMLPDITILHPKNLSILHSTEVSISSEGIRYEEYPTKKYTFGGDTIIIELKFCRNEAGLKASDIRRFKKDIEKIIMLQNLSSERTYGRSKIHGIFVVFNKTNIGKSTFESMHVNYNSRERLHVLYKTGGVNFINVNPLQPRL